MKYPKISTTIKAYKELFLLNNEKTVALVHNDILDKVHEHVKNDNFKDALAIEKSINLSMYKDEHKVEKEFKYILKNQILHELISELQKDMTKYNEMAVSLLPNMPEHKDLLNIAFLNNTDNGIYEVMSVLEKQSFNLKGAILHLFHCAQHKKNEIKALKKDQTDLHNLNIG